MTFVYNKIIMKKLIQYADSILIQPYFTKRNNLNQNENIFSIVSNTFWFENTTYNYACAYYDSSDGKYTVAVGYWDYLGSFAVSFNGEDSNSVNVIKNAIELIPCPYLAEIVPVDKKYYKGYWYTILLKAFNVNCNTTKADFNDSEEEFPIRDPGEPSIFDIMNDEDYSIDDKKEFDKQLDPLRQIVEGIKKGIIN